jgi:hypothetical protein
MNGNSAGISDGIVMLSALALNFYTQDSKKEL